MEKSTAALTIENNQVVGKSLNDFELEQPEATKDAKNQQNCCTISIYDILEVVLLVPVILAAIAFFSIPTIFYVLSDSNLQVSGY